jgi:hypothetical protein
MAIYAGLPLINTDLAPGWIKKWEFGHDLGKDIPIGHHLDGSEAYWQWDYNEAAGQLCWKFNDPTDDVAAGIPKTIIQKRALVEEGLTLVWDLNLNLMSIFEYYEALETWHVGLDILFQMDRKSTTKMLTAYPGQVTVIAVTRSDTVFLEGFGESKCSNDKKLISMDECTDLCVMKEIAKDCKCMDNDPWSCAFGYPMFFDNETALETLSLDAQAQLHCFEEGASFLKFSKGEICML